jgi:hypothetical protein
MDFGGKKTKKRVVFGKRKTVNMKKLNCSPEYKNRFYEESCYNKKILFKIRDAHNKTVKADADKIQSDTFKDVYDDLKTKMQKFGCVKEDCWLQTLSYKEREYLDSVVFAPHHPDEWDKNPTEWLSNYDINSIMKQYDQFYPEFTFIGSTTMDFDEKPTDYDGDCVCNNMCNFKVSDCIKKGIRKVGFTINLDNHNESGSHWVSMFLDLDDKIIFYFDSANNPTPRAIKTFVERVKKQCLDERIKIIYKKNKHPHQKSNTECGMYSIFFIVTMLTGDIGRSKLLTKQQKIDLFVKNRIKDSYMIRNRGTIFNSKK